MVSQAIRTVRARWAQWRARLRAALQLRAAAQLDEELPAEELARVRLTAELAADRLACGEIALIANPWRRGTRCFVLWETSYHARLMHHEFADTYAEEEQAEAGDAEVALAAVMA
jgi:hypothetical protein